MNIGYKNMVQAVELASCPFVPQLHSTEGETTEQTAGRMSVPGSTPLNFTQVLPPPPYPNKISIFSNLRKDFRQQKIHGTISTVPGPSSPCGSWQLAEPRHVSAGLPPVASSSGAQPTERHQGPSEAVGACKAAWLQPSSRGCGPSRLGNTSLLFVCHVSAENFERKKKTKQNTKVISS